MQVLGKVYDTASTVTQQMVIFHTVFKSVVFNLGVATPMGVFRHFSRGREKYLVFVRNLFVADPDVVNVFSGNDATQGEFIALKNDSTAKDAFKSGMWRRYFCKQLAHPHISLPLPNRFTEILLVKYDQCVGSR